MLKQMLQNKKYLVGSQRVKVIFGKQKKMVTSLGNFKWNVQFCLLQAEKTKKIWIFFVCVFFFLISLLPQEELAGFFQDQGAVLGICCNIPSEGMEISGIVD